MEIYPIVAKDLHELLLKTIGRKDCKIYITEQLYDVLKHMDYNTYSIITEKIKKKIFF